MSKLIEKPIEYECSGCMNCGRLFAVPMNRPHPKDPWHCPCDNPSPTYLTPADWFYYSSRWLVDHGVTFDASLLDPTKPLRLTNFTAEELAEGFAICEA